MLKTLCRALWFTLLTAAALAQSDPRPAARSWRQAHEPEIVREFAGLLSIPNVASDQVNIRRNADHIAVMLRERDVEVRLLDTGGPPIVFGEIRVPGARHTLILYAHYDGQPVNAAQWASDPWKPVLRNGRLEDGAKIIPLDELQPPLNPEWRIYARSAGDDKLPVQALVSALDALRAAKVPLAVNLKIFLDGEEEAGSPHLAAAIERYRNLLSGDAWLLCDGPVHQSRRMQVHFGARGIVDVELTVFGPLRPLHSGHYGNWAPNPAVLLTELLASMRDSNGNIGIAGFNDDVRPLTASERQALEQIPQADEQLKEELGLAWSEGEQPLSWRIMQPALNVRGVESGNVRDKAQNAIPTEARASIDFRLVPDLKPEGVKQLVEAHIAKRGFHIVRQAPDMTTRRKYARIVRVNWGEGYPAARSSMDLPVARAVMAAVEEGAGGPIIKVPMLGGSLPMYLFTDVLQSPVIGVPVANHDNNQHGINENLRLQNLWDAIEIYASILAGTERHWK